jgi:hypothetical protein
MQEHDTEAVKFRKLKTTEADTDYILYHAPKSAQATRFGQSGPLGNPFGRSDEAWRNEEKSSGYTYAYSPLKPGSDTMMSYAADFAALLCLGGVSHMTSDPAIKKVYQIFRNWSLDRRRVNEWRMLIAGGALSEKHGQPTSYDSTMAKPELASWTAPMGAASEEAEKTALKMGWVPLFRQWFDMSSRPDVKPLAEESLNPNNPTNRELSRGMAFLLDLADPVEVP